MARQLDPSTDADLPQNPEAKALREACRWDVQRFAETFFTHLCDTPFSSMHEDFFARWQLLQGRRDVHEVTAAPRGGAKTTIRVTIKGCHDCVYGHEQFLVIVAARHDLVVDRIGAIRDELETNAELLRVFGPQKTKRWGKESFTTTHGVTVLGVSRRQAIRGLNRKGRPTKVILDDAERSDEVHSEVQREKFWRWLMGDALKLGTTGYTNYEMIGTVLHEQSALARLLQNPGWTPFRYQAVLAYADQAPHLWQEWREIYCGRDSTSRDEARDQARAFFEAHQDEMLAGSHVLWPERESYYQLMEMILTEGELAFETEKQNNPAAAVGRKFLLDQAGYVHLLADRLIRAGGQVVLMSDLIEICAYWDPALGGEKGLPDYSCCVVGAKDRFGLLYALDCYLDNRDEPDAQCTAVAELLWRWQVQKVGIESNMFQSLLVPDLQEAIARLNLEAGTLYRPQYVEIRNTRNKTLRMSTLIPYVNHRWLYFNVAFPAEFFRQFRVWNGIEEADKNDAIDATEGLVRVLRGLVDKRAQQT